HFTLIDFPVFNVADCFVVMGTILLAYYILFIADKVEREVV
ncbi:MAG: signal peptidase II, partial [Clostridiales bacterium]|nr:signal peptidase II [Clostridiales bacterium]